MKIHFKPMHASGKVVADLKDITYRWGEKTILLNSSEQIIRGDRIALLGANGIGKSTLLNIIGGELKPQNGIVTLGYKVQHSHYAQHQLSQLNERNTLFEEVAGSVPVGVTEQDIRNSLGAFLFSGDDVNKSVCLLSGGERARLSLCKVMLSKANFLLLDEPTNHLDMPSIQVLINALQDYEGTLLFVSHNRHFIQSVARSIWHIQAQRIKNFLGSFEEWEYAMQEQETKEEKGNKETKKAPPAPACNHKEGKKQIEQKMARIEADLAQLKKEENALAEELSSLAHQALSEKYRKCQQSYQDIIHQIAHLEQTYETLFDNLWN